MLRLIMLTGVTKFDPTMVAAPAGASVEQEPADLGDGDPTAGGDDDE
jgi:hypothetical protein